MDMSEILSKKIKNVYNYEGRFNLCEMVVKNFFFCFLKVSELEVNVKVTVSTFMKFFFILTFGVINT